MTGASCSQYSSQEYTAAISSVAFYSNALLSAAMAYHPSLWSGWSCNQWWLFCPDTLKHSFLYNRRKGHRYSPRASPPLHEPLTCGHVVKMEEIVSFRLSCATMERV